MESATFRDSDAMLVDANDDPTASKPQYHRHSVKKGFPKFARGLMLSTRNLQMGSIVLEPRPPFPSPNPLKPVSHSKDSPTMMTMLSPTPNDPQNTSVFTPKRKRTRMFEGALEALDRVINRTRKRERVGDDLDAQIVDSNSSQYDSSMESMTPQPPRKTPRRGTFWPSSLLFAPPGLERHSVERPVASPNPNLPIFSNPQPSIISHESRPATPPATPRPDDHKKRGHIRIGRLIRASVANPARPLKRRLSTLKDFLLPHPFDAHLEVANQPQLDQTIGDETVPVLSPIQPGNVRSGATDVPTAKPVPMPVCSNPKSFYYDGEEPKTRCESPDPIPQYYEHFFSGPGPSTGNSTGGNRYMQQLPTHMEGTSIYADPYAMDVVVGPEN